MQAPPSATTWGLPLIGAARKSTPASVAAARTAAEVAVETVEQSTMVPGRCCPDSNPSGPPTTSSRSFGVETITKTTSQLPRSAIRSTAVAPRATSGAVLDLSGSTPRPTPLRRSGVWPSPCPSARYPASRDKWCRVCGHWVLLIEVVMVRRVSTRRGRHVPRARVADPPGGPAPSTPRGSAPGWTVRTSRRGTARLGILRRTCPADRRAAVVGQRQPLKVLPRLRNRVLR